MKGVPEGQRREAVFKLSSKLRRADVPFDIAEKLIIEAWKNCDPGSHAFTEREAMAQLNDAYQRYPAGQAEQNQTDDKAGNRKNDSDPWGRIKKAPDFAEVDKEIKGLAKDHRSARRKNRTDYRLAFIPSKFRLGAEPEPFCLEVSVPKDQPWTLTDVTADIIKGGDDAIEGVRAKEEKRMNEAADALAIAVTERAARGDPILKTDAEEFLHNEGVTRAQARSIVESKKGVLWRIGDPGKAAQSRSILS